MKKTARLGGFLYLLIIVFGLIAQIFVRDALVHYDNPSVTAQRILNSELWFRFGFLCELLMLVSDVGVTTILFILFWDKVRELTLLSTILRACSIAILGVVAITHYASLSFLKNPGPLDVFNTDQLNALGLLSIKMHGIGYNVSLFFFGFHLVILGLIIYKSGLIPKIIGVLLSIGGICYIVNSTVWFLFPAMVSFIYPAILIPCALGEWVFCFWLMLKGIRPITKAQLNN